MTYKFSDLQVLRPLFYSVFGFSINGLTDTLISTIECRIVIDIVAFDLAMQKRYNPLQEQSLLDAVSQFCGIRGLELLEDLSIK